VGQVVSLRTGRCAHHAEVQRLRRDLHDGLGPGLAGILIRADLLARQLDRQHDGGPAEEMLRELRREAAGFMAEFRRVLADREPAELEGRSLADGLRVLADRMHLAGLAIDLDVTGDADRDTQVAAFWIVKEALTNVVKHANATRCAITVRADDGLHLSVADNGTGGLGEHGVGLTSMRARAEELGGWCEVTDTGHGVTVSGHLPEGRSRDDHAACA
jgi:two-component system, NarL family, sensor kinase